MKHQQDCSHEHDDMFLVADILAGNRDAFALLFQRYAPSVQRLCTRLLGTSTEAQDIVQEAALQAFLGLSHLREPARFSAWFHAIAANLARSALRRQRESSLQGLGEEILIDRAWSGSPPTLEESLFQRETQETITQALQALSPAHRQALIGFYLQGYSYGELASQLGIPVSTLKWRLFEGRKLLRVHLQSLAETMLSPVENQQRKEKTMTTADVVTLHIDSLRHVPFTRQYLALLRDPTSQHVLPVSLTEAEFSTLQVAFRVRQDANAPLIPQDLSQRLLESFGTHLQQIMINALVGQILYATATFKQAARVRSVDMRLAEALVLAVREDAPISITRALFEARAAADLTGGAQPLSEEALLIGGKTSQKLGREERLLWEEAVRRQYLPTLQTRPKQLWERLWAILLMSLGDSLDALSTAEQGSLDLAHTFPARTATWDAQPVVAIQLFDQEEVSWLLMPPAVWETILRQGQGWDTPEDQQEASSVATHRAPDVFTPPLQQQAEEMLERLLELPAVRTAFLLDPAGKVSVWKGSETRESLQHFCDTKNDLFRPFRVQEARDPESQGQERFTTFFVKPQAPSPQPLEAPDVNRFLASHESGWRLVVLFQEASVDQRRQDTHQRLEEARQAFLRLLTQQVQE